MYVGAVIRSDHCPQPLGVLEAWPGNDGQALPHVSDCRISKRLRIELGGPTVVPQDLCDTQGCIL
jgi:hypothetical protein